MGRGRSGEGLEHRQPKAVPVPACTIPRAAALAAMLLAFSSEVPTILDHAGEVQACLGAQSDADRHVCA